MKLDPYKHKERYTKWKEKVAKYKKLGNAMNSGFVKRRLNKFLKSIKKS